MKKLAIFVSSILLPVATFAADTNLSNFQQMANGLAGIVSTLIPVAFGLAILFFFWGLATYIIGKDQDKEVAKKRMLWGVIAIFIMASIWGIVNFIGSSFGISDNTQSTTSIKLPSVN